MRGLSLVSVCLLTLAAVLAAGLPAAAQDGDAVEPLTMIAHFQAPPDDSFPDWVRSTYGAAMDGLMAEGKVLSWGVVMPVFHQNMDTTHSVFVTATDWAAIEAAFQAIDTREGAMSAEEQAATGELFSKMDMSTHRDELVRHLRFEVGGDGTPPTKYYDIGYHAARPGKGQQVMELYDRMIKPVYDQLLADGVVTGYGVFVPEQHAGEGWTHAGWAGLADLAKMDAVSAAFAAAEASWTPEDFRLLDEVFENSAHTDLLLRVVD